MQKESSTAVRECIPEGIKTPGTALAHSDQHTASSFAEDPTSASFHTGQIFSEVSAGGGDRPGCTSQSSNSNDNLNHTFNQKTCIFKKRFGTKKAGIRNFCGLPHNSFTKHISSTSNRNNVLSKVIHSSDRNTACSGHASVPAVVPNFPDNFAVNNSAADDQMHDQHIGKQLTASFIHDVAKAKITDKTFCDDHREINKLSKLYWQ